MLLVGVWCVVWCVVVWCVSVCGGVVCVGVCVCVHESTVTERDWVCV
jgi:hypothetical protein